MSDVGECIGFTNFYLHYDKNYTYANRAGRIFEKTKEGRIKIYDIVLGKLVFQTNNAHNLVHTDQSSESMIRKFDNIKEYVKYILLLELSS